MAKLKQNTLNEGILDMFKKGGSNPDMGQETMEDPFSKDSEKRSMVGNFPKKLLELTVRQNNRTYQINYYYKDERGKTQQDSETLRELDPRILGSILRSKGIFPTKSTKYEFDTQFDSPEAYEAEVSRLSYESAKNSWRESNKHVSRDTLDSYESEAGGDDSMNESKEKNYMKMLIESLENKKTNEGLLTFLFGKKDKEETINDPYEVEKMKKRSNWLEQDHLKGPDAENFKKFFSNLEFGMNHGSYGVRSYYQSKVQELFSSWGNGFRNAREQAIKISWRTGSGEPVVPFPDAPTSLFHMVGGRYTGKRHQRVRSMVFNALSDLNKKSRSDPYPNKYKNYK